MNTYEYGVYNKYVRDAIRQGDGTPPFLSPEWENVYYFTVYASSKEMAQKKAEAKHSPVTGFVIESLEQIND
tara:strand:- start:223 stop:438 length:216 start_codon:yes stop_codon:yes gene_type:complete